MKIILASESPSRKALLERLGVPFIVVPANIDEQGLIRERDIHTPKEHVMALSKAKAQHVASKSVPPCAIIAADTVIYHNNTILEKPADEEDAFNMIKSLQGKMHEVYTGVTIVVKGQGLCDEVTSFCDTAQVRLRLLDDSEITAYVNTGEPMGRSGSYAINGLGSLLIDLVNGDFNTVVGLPLARTYVELKELDIDLMELRK